MHCQLGNNAEFTSLREREEMQKIGIDSHRLEREYIPLVHQIGYGGCALCFRHPRI